MTTSRAGTTPAIVLVVVGLACQEVGASLAVLLFPEVGPLGMVMLRLVFSAIILLLIARPGLRGHSREGWLAVLGFGVVLAVMNGLFYLALERLPLGVTVTIEVLGPLVLSIVASRRLSAWLWALLALAGVAALGGGGWDRLDPLGVLFALGAAASWAFYILASARVGREFPKLDGLALAMTAGALIALPFGILSGGLRPAPAGAARARCRGRDPLLDHPVRPRAHRAATTAGRGVRDPDEPRPGDRRTRRMAAARTGARLARDRRHRAGHRREHRGGALGQQGGSGCRGIR